MPIYHYRARSEDGTEQNGMLEAENEGELYRLLQDQNRLLLSSYTADEKKKKRRVQIKTAELAEFSKQLATLIGSGVTLARALQIISEDESIKEKARAVHKEVLQLVKLGYPLSDSMAETKAYPDFMVNLIRSAEDGGNLEKTAYRLSEHYERQKKLASKISMAFMYPKILFVILLVVLVVLCNFVLPQFESLFSTMPSLPPLTVFVMTLGDIVTGYWWLALLIGFGLWTLAKALYRVQSIRLFVDRMKVKVPVFGKLNAKIYTARFALTLSTLYASGISILNAIQIAQTTIGNAYIEDQFTFVLADLRAGQNLSDSLSRVDGFSKKLSSAVRVGEESGSLDTMLTASATNLTFEADIAIDKMVAYIEPCIIVLMAGIVGVIVIGVLMPIADSYQYIGGANAYM